MGKLQFYFLSLLSLVVQTQSSQQKRTTWKRVGIGASEIN